ncbi:hypothetical protein TrST_g17 [Triparma strigata]|uniref:Uncharacterized protein n=1 Tax=Triparma strigata TaxID=1606541 RepID=A0A9W7AQF5_9STRA|nr:hypothetical protein TrST_g17 [Triparma strigata]
MPKRKTLSNADIDLNPSSIRLTICEDHNHVLPHIYDALRAICRRSRSTSTSSPATSTPPTFRLIHFDSHPDLSILPTLEKSHIGHTHALQDELDGSQEGISCWITPLILQGSLKVVDWVHQDFCEQIEDGSHVVKLGWDSEGVCKTSSNLEYYIEDGCEYKYSKEGELSNPVEFTVNSTTAPNLLSSSSSCSVSGYWILDICLDYFVVSNPWLDTPFFKEIHEKVEASGIADAQAMVREWKLSGKYEYDEKTWGEILECCRYTKLPHCPELKEGAFNEFKDLLLLAKSRCESAPSCITVARSAEDGFISLDLVEDVQERVLQIVKAIWKVDVHIDY